MKVWGEPVSKSAIQPKAVEAVVPLCMVAFGGTRGVVERNRASDEARAALGDRPADDAMYSRVRGLLQAQATLFRSLY